LRIGDHVWTQTEHDRKQVAALRMMQERIRAALATPNEGSKT
jgi:hypothetical protein